ncbi:MAG: hypothetical protein UW88_C0021G0019 [Candidatus Collierbacteria bacterium GW2011_GWD2_45_10]|nr:MAG: hypothetical protein UW56_C0016G0007 [Candidatus Collierbacteria bacterium GW2011_GWD1_44_27]KKT87797.1 MAG: hypothetical protein UW88_C0021G0019 [Candidatus Collierbacteria bacterium GW2011_GWD2_45_10]
MKFTRFQRVVACLLGLILVFVAFAACNNISGTNNTDTVQASENVQADDVLRGTPMVDAEGDVIAFFFVIKTGLSTCYSVVSVDSYRAMLSTGTSLSCP